MRPRIVIRFFVFAALVLGTLSIVALYLDQRFALEAKQVPSEADKKPENIYATTLPDGAGKQQSLGQWQDKLLVINFWATWCAPCREEMPQLDDLQKRFSANGLQIVGIAADNQLTVAKFGKSIKVAYPLLADEMGALDFSKRLGNHLGLLPHTVVVLPGGKAVFSKLGKINVAEMTTIIQQNTPKKR